MRIALLPSAYAPAVGGVEVLTARLAQELLARNHAVEVWTARGPGDALPAKEHLEGVDVRRFTFSMPRLALASLVAAPVTSVVTLAHLRSASQAFQPDILHVQCYSGNGAYAAALSRLLKIPLLVTLQGETVMDDHDIYDHSLTLRQALRVGLRRAAAVTGCSQFVLDDARRRFGLDMSKARVVFNGVDIEETPPTPVELPFDRYVLALGRVVRKKGFDLLLDAFADAAGAQEDVGLVVGGEGPERDALIRHAANLDIANRVHMPGKLSRGAVATVMSNAELFVMPSRVEPFGIVALEAWRAGIPAIVTSRGGAGEFVEHGVSGIVVDPFDRTALASAIASLLGAPRERASLADAARKRLPAFSWAATTDHYEGLYREIAGA
jgi:glycogen(starch) synthase